MLASFQDSLVHNPIAIHSRLVSLIRTCSYGQQANFFVCTNINVWVCQSTVPQGYVPSSQAKTECNLDRSLSVKFSLHANLQMHLMMMIQFCSCVANVRRWNNSVYTRCGVNDATISIVTFPFTWSLLWFHWGKASLCHRMFLEFTGLEKPELFSFAPKY